MSLFRSKVCPDGYSLFNESCYGGPGRDVLNWDDARAACVELTTTFASFHLDFDLVSIHSDEENLFVHNIPHNGYFLLGFRRDAGETNFTWSDESHVDYTKWCDDYPDNDVSTIIFGISHYLRFPTLTPNFILTYLIMIFLKMSEDACAQMVYVNHLGVVWVDNECVIPSTDQYHYLCKGVYIGKF